VIVVLDTNVLVSALISPFGNPARVVDLVLTGDLVPAYDDRLVAEYRSVLRRARFGFDPGSIEDLLAFIAGDGIGVTAPPWPMPLPDPDDAAFLEVAAAAGATLITGNARHFPAGVTGSVVVATPAEFLAAWSSHGPRPSGSRSPGS